MALNLVGQNQTAEMMTLSLQRAAQMADHWAGKMEMTMADLRPDWMAG